MRQLWSRRHGWPLGMPAPLKLTGSWAACQYLFCLPHSSSSAPAGRCSALCSLCLQRLPSKRGGLESALCALPQGRLGECAETARGPA